jgi:xanthine dehydrogenase large subunit
MRPDLQIPTASDVPADFSDRLCSILRQSFTDDLSLQAVGEPPLMLAISVFCAINDAYRQPQARCRAAA